MLATDLPTPPPFDRWVLEQPIPVAAICVLAGAAVFVALVRRGQTRRGLLGCTVLTIMGLGALAAGYLIETPRETLSRLTSRFVSSVFAADADWAGEHLADSLVVASAGTVYLSLGKKELVDSIRNFEMFRTREWSAKIRGASIDGESVGRTQSTIKVAAGFIGNLTLPSTWEFTWRRGPDGKWTISRLECISMWGQPPTMNWEREAIGIARLKPGSGSLKPDAF